ncbi:YXWGXW repeat-containing protein [Chryseobacterium sp.]|uniref:YXWGXW repeat-containing protein n=1 Tax=Chryseobacterium sp. TaxID=1871047 RepID=UPI0025B88EE7|nr:YXWGXW repeat-containing protein [Chryseobacterium sp.]MBV8325017.1 YXWGXW repeat-containing protein [Chryseobacterium sp.]
MKNKESSFHEKLFLMKEINEFKNNDLLHENFYFKLKKLLVIAIITLFATASVFGQNTGYIDDRASISVRTELAPPPLPDYVQPPCPGDGYLWTPGYWAWATGGYYWVAGVWVLPPAIDLLWTPGYWAFYDGFYGWHPGYWGSRVGYYGGINYGFGYFGNGFYGGRWDRGHFMYNTSVWRVDKNVHNTYINKVNIVNTNRMSFNGDKGVNYHPNKDEMDGMRDNRISASKEQMDHERNMGNNTNQFHNNSGPAIHSMNFPGGQGFDERGREMRMGGMRSGGGRGRR